MMVQEKKMEHGDVIQLGRHRLMRGDSTNVDDVNKLFSGVTRPKIIVTDPPYGVNYDPGWRDKKLGHGARRTGEIKNDDTPDWSKALEVFPECEVLYCWSPMADNFIYFGNLIQDQKFVIRSVICWAKHYIRISQGHYHNQHEMCIYAVKKGATANWVGDRKQSTLWFFDKRKTEELSYSDHPTQKPIECMERPIKNHEGDVYDPYVGTGTTIIAAEKQGRTCYAMELNPDYCDVIIRRWNEYNSQLRMF